MIVLRKLRNNNRKLIQISNKKFSNDAIDIPTIDINKYLKKQEGWENECKKVSECLYETGILVVKEPEKL